MPAYRYQAVDNSGKRETGLLQAETRRLARETLRERGIIVLELEAVESDAPGGGKPLKARGRLSAARLGLLLGQLGSIMRAGVPIERALEACGQSVTGEREKEVLAALRSDVLAGFPLSEAMRRQRRIFDPFCVAVVRAGERSGLIDQVIERLADHLERRHAISQKIKLALIYPALLVGVSLIIIIGLMQFVIPQVAAVFAHNKQGLPALTRALLNTADFLRASWLWLFVVLLAAAVWLKLFWARMSGLRSRWQAFLGRVPVLGAILHDSDVARVVSTLGLLTGSGVPLVSALSASTDVAGLEAIRKGFREVGEAVEQGASLGRAMTDAQCFPPLVPLLAGSGEESGRLPEMLDEAARRLSSSVEVRIDAMVRLFEPAVVLFMGGAVLLIVLAVLLPIFEMNQLVK
ncbi:MAG: hypothetical protein RIR70_1084 [Pseudomonadota bacterium]